MAKNWTSAPWVIRLIVLYRIVPALLLVGSFGLLVFWLTQSEVGGAWRLPMAMLAGEYEVMPISTSVDIGLTLMFTFGAYYGWRLLRGSGFARSILQVFSAIFALVTLVALVFPEVQYLELESVPDSLPEGGIAAWLIGGLLACIEAAVALGLRTRAAKEYANVF